MFLIMKKWDEIVDIQYITTFEKYQNFEMHVLK